MFVCEERCNEIAKMHFLSTTAVAILGLGYVSTMWCFAQELQLIPYRAVTLANNYPDLDPW
jgi:hypothetical protein